MEFQKVSPSTWNGHSISWALCSIWGQHLCHARWPPSFHSATGLADVSKFTWELYVLATDRLVENSWVAPN